MHIRIVKCTSALVRSLNETVPSSFSFAFMPRGTQEYSMVWSNKLRAGMGPISEEEGKNEAQM